MKYYNENFYFNFISIYVAKFLNIKTTYTNERSSKLDNKKIR